MHKPIVRLEDYRPPAWRMQTVDIDFDLDVEETLVSARLLVIQDPAQQEVDLRLDGENIELLEIRVDGRELASDQFRIAGALLTIEGVRGEAVIETRSRIRPAGNSAMQGLYLSGSGECGFLLSQCEAEGFRHITWSIDRPDVLACYTVTLRADRSRFPILLAGGNPDGDGELDGARHWARFVDPQPKPSYLFAIVAGQLAVIEDSHVTAEGRSVRLKIWAPAPVIERCRYALDCLKAAMVWDEQRFGRNYRLDVFHVVATDDFTMGAMENTGLNIFNSKYLLADPLHATDDDYRHVLAVVAHEYFHNWTGNRVTCRDWFQLCLKEGLTVYREQEFVADHVSRALRRIEDVRVLWRNQFSEDSGPLAHPVRPSEYREINNFYTATVYEKGAEIVRMLATLLGTDGFRRGMDLYFERHDCAAVTVEDFLAALGDANDRDLGGWLVWYTQAGTPLVEVDGTYDAAARSFELKVSQGAAPTMAAGSAARQTVPIPLALALFDAAGNRLAMDLEGAQAGLSETVVLLDHACMHLTFHNLDSIPVPSLLRGYSAPVRIAQPADWRAWVMLATHEDDGFNRWQAAESVNRHLFVAALRGDVAGEGALDAWMAGLRLAFSDQDLDPATLAEMLTVPDEATLGESLDVIDPAAIHRARQRLEQAMARALEPELLARYEQLAPASAAGTAPSAQAQRRLRNACLAMLCHADRRHHALAHRHYRDATCLSDTLAALTCLVHGGDVDAEQVLEHFAAQYSRAPTVMDRWFSLQATIADVDVLERIRALTRHALFRWDNPNKVYALLLGFALRNPTGFHREDGAGYRFVADAILQLDRITPQVAARLCAAFSAWRRYPPGLREQMRMEMQRMHEVSPISADLADILARSLGRSGDEAAPPP
ncbi:MAG: aminopeptidase N [Xanthomonadales bacterium]|nr:aminopeptidase N [Xanthomonadales bacterium]